jgi:hypothetical protein
MDGSTFLESGLIITSEIAGGDTVEDDTLKWSSFWANRLLVITQPHTW